MGGLGAGRLRAHLFAAGDHGDTQHRAVSLLAVPAASHLLGPDFRLRAPKPADANDAGARGEHPIINLAILAVMTIATIALVALDYLTGDKDLGWQPIDQRALAAVRACDGPLYNHYDQGGYLIWFVPEKPVLSTGARIRTRWSTCWRRSTSSARRHPTARCSIAGASAACFSPWSPTVKALDRDGWMTRYRDDNYPVLSGPPAR